MVATCCYSWRRSWLEKSFFKSKINYLKACCQDGRAVQGAAFRSQSTLVGVGSNPTSDMFTFLKLYVFVFVFVVVVVVVVVVV